jgi:hypothetical protein
MTGVLAAGLILAACSSGHSSPAARPPAVPGENTQAPDLSGVRLPNFVMPPVNGQVSRPKAALTPGAVTTTDTDQVCEISPHTSAPPIPVATQAAVAAAYGYPATATALASQHAYVLDYLVPYDLGGAATQDNLWPAAIKGTGFTQKTQTDDILHQLVCRRSITLAQAQQALEADWYAAWLRYVVAGGHS